MNPQNRDQWPLDGVRTDAEQKLMDFLDPFETDDPEFCHFSQEECDQSSFRKTLLKKKQTRRTVLRAACVAIVFVTAVVGTSIWLNSESASAIRFKLEEIRFEMRGGTYTNEPAGNSDQESFTVEYTGMEGLSVAMKDFPELLAPKYLPEGFELKRLQVTRFDSGMLTGFYQFEKDTEWCDLDVTYLIDGNKEIKILKSGEELLMDSGRKLYFWKDESQESNNAGVAIGDSFVTVMGSIPKKEIISICEHLE